MIDVLAVGYGRIGEQRVQGLVANAHVREIVVCDPKLPPETQLGPKIRVGSHHALGQKYDAAIISTPNDVAAEFFPLLAMLSPYVLMEKPLGRSLAEAEHLVQAALRARCQLFVGLNYRFLRNVQKVRDLLRMGQFGKLLSVNVVLAHGGAPGFDTSWKTDRVRCGGGACLDLGVHAFDLLHFLLDEKQMRLNGATFGCSYWNINVEDHTSATLSLGNGALAHVFLSFSSWQSRFDITMEFERAMITIRGRGNGYGPQEVLIIPHYHASERAGIRESKIDFGNDNTSLFDETNEFIDIVRGRIARRSIATSQEALAAMRIVDDCYQAQKQFPELQTRI